MNYSKTIEECIAELQPLKIEGDTKLKISSIEYDSRKVKKSDGNIGSAFFALPGIHVDGKKFIAKAIENGASAIFYEGELPNELKEELSEKLKDANKQRELCLIQVENIRSVMARVSANFYENPSKDLGVIGVTGTEGKSSTVSFIFQLLNLCGEKAGFFSTVEYSFGDEVIPNAEHQTTPESNIVQKRIAQMRDNNCKFAVVESSSHGLSPLTARLENVLFDAGIFINVTQEHLEFHKTLEQYRYDKANLFRALDKSKEAKTNKDYPMFGIVNYEDKNADYFINATKEKVYSFSTDTKQESEIKNKNGYFAKDIKESSKGISFTICEFSEENKNNIQEKITREYPAEIRLSALFNVQNILASVICVHKITGIDLKSIIEKLPEIKSIKGRMQNISEGQDFEVIIDYAHTPSSFMTIFPAVKERIKKQNGKVICVFGSGGERDLKKRPEQGRIAALYSDIVILADEDPRGEDPKELLQMIADGCENKTLNEDLFIIPDRATAIKKAFSLANKNDGVLLLGKGHENSIIYKDKTIPYDEEKTARKILKDLL